MLPGAAAAAAVAVDSSRSNGPYCGFVWESSTEVERKGKEWEANSRCGVWCE